MSIVPLVKVTVYGHAADKEPVLAGLQNLGCLHLISLAPDQAARAAGPTPEARTALRFLQRCPRQRRQVRDPGRFDAEEVERRALEIRSRTREREDEVDRLRARIEELRPWGDFRLPPLEQLGGNRLWFYIVPHRDLERVKTAGLAHEVVSRDLQHAYVVVVSPDEPRGMPVERTRAGQRPLSEVRQRLEDVALEIEDLQAEREALTRWCLLFGRSLNQLEDRANLRDAMGLTYDSAPLFALQGWAPTDREDALQRFAHLRRLALDMEGPSEKDTPPTLLRNAAALQGGEALVSFYMTPNYWLWDPSGVVFFSFAVFFAMILSDAGYAAVMAAGLALGWRRLGRSPTGSRLRPLFASLVGASLLWGALVGSYFGVAPGADSPLAGLKLLDLGDNTTMMTLAVLVGVAHVVLANAADAWRLRRSAAVLAPLGWMALLAGAVVVWVGSAHAGPGVQRTGLWAMGLGAAAVLLFTGVRAPLGKRLLQGLLALTRVSSAFGDVLSYLRLFALGLASASLALAFNDLAAQVATAVPGLGKLLALLVLLIGHGLNFLLGITSGFIHGLRLNFIEFFNWSVPEEGTPFRPFSRKESSSWSR
ncbi:MAG: hypothetical protein P1P84_07295 [Deferrisomatales bacterium]|nr:hypothetical protein [Deferrisomatales bacterium]